MKCSTRAPLIAVLVLLAAAGMVLQAGSVAHVHVGDQAGLYNEEHDLTLLASLAGHGLPADTAVSLALDRVSAPLPPFVPERPATSLAQSGESRAPPAH